MRTIITLSALGLTLALGGAAIANPLGPYRAQQKIYGHGQERSLRAVDIGIEWEARRPERERQLSPEEREAKERAAAQPLSVPDPAQNRLQDRGKASTTAVPTPVAAMTPAIGSGGTGRKPDKSKLKQIRRTKESGRGLPPEKTWMALSPLS
jgi:hypothetical protein